MTFRVFQETQRRGHETSALGFVRYKSPKSRHLDAAQATRVHGHGGLHVFVKWLSGKQVEVQLDGSAVTEDLKAQDDCLLRIV